MSADADGEESMQPGFLAALAAAIAKNAIVAENQDIGDELLIASVLFGVAAIEIHNLRGRGDHRQVFLDFDAESLKNAEFFKELSSETKHSLFCCHELLPFVSCDNQEHSPDAARQDCHELLTRYSQSQHN